MVTYFANAEFAANLSVKCLDFEVISEIFCTCKKFEPKVSESKNVFVKSNREIKPNGLIGKIISNSISNPDISLISSYKPLK